MSNQAQHNRHQHNQNSAVSVLPDQHPFTTYRMEARTAAGALVASLWQWSNAKTKDTVNAHGDISFDYPYTATAWAYFAFPNQIWLRDDRGNLKEKYHITTRTRGQGLDGSSKIEVTGRSLIYQLARETVSNFYAGSEQQTITLPAGVTAGTFTLGFRGQTTSALAYNVNAASMQTALTGLSTIGSGQATVTGSGPWVVTFAGTLLETDVPLLRADGSSLTGGTLIKVATTRTTKTVREVVQSLFDMQVNTLPIYLGVIDNAIGSNNVQLKIENKSILAALLELRDLYGGYFWVNPSNRRFYWKRRQGRSTGQYVRIGKNGQHIEEIEDYSAMANRITALGKGETIESTLSVTVNDSTSQSTYGIVPDIIVDKTIWNMTDLTAFANANLQARKVPKKSYRIGVIDLARLTSGDYSFFELEVGSKIRVIDTDFSLAIDTTIASIERELDTGSVGAGSIDSGSASKVRISVTNPDAGTSTWGANEPSIIPAEERDVTDTVADIIEALQDEQADTGFYDSLADTLPQVIQGDNSTSELVREIVTELVEQAIDAGTITVPTPGTDVQSIGTANSAGDNSNTYARDDHVHKGSHFSASSAASLPAEGEGSDGVTTGTNKRAYVRVDSAWTCLTHIE